MLNMVEGIESHDEELFGCQVTTVDIQTEQAADLLGRTVGQYITIESPGLLHKGMEITEVGECLAAVLDRVLRPHYQGKLCICGMGNRNVPADSLGPEVTYALPLKAFSKFNVGGNFRDVCSFAPGTDGTNNIDTEIIMGGIVRAADADCVLLVDSSITNNVSRLFRTIQLSASGGVDSYWYGRKRKWSVLGVPVVSLCVPTTIPLSNLCPEKEQGDINLTDMMVQEVIDAASIIISYAILRVCWPSLSKKECFVYAKLNRDQIPYSTLFESGTDSDNEDNICNKT